MFNHPLFIFTVRSLQDFLQLEFPARGSKYHLAASLDWLCNAQDSQIDGGVSAYYSIKNGWAPSFIETTGYILSTFLRADALFPKKKLADRAQRMADFLLAMQLPSGGFRTYTPRQTSRSKPTVFNTGQDILGLCEYYQWSKQKKYLDAAVRAAEFLSKIQNKNGSWTTFETDVRPHTYHSRVGWSLIWTGILAKRPTLIQAGRQSLDWVVEQQRENGWMKHSLLPGLDEPHPITHTIAYAAEGLWYGGTLLNEEKYRQAALKTATALLKVYQQDQELWATYDEVWQSQSDYVCLTGNAQVAVLWLEMAVAYKQPGMRQAAKQLLTSIKNRQDTRSNLVSRGGIAGSYPIYGSLVSAKGYCRCAFVNWASKFFADALLLELKET